MIAILSSHFIQFNCFGIMRFYLIVNKRRNFGTIEILIIAVSVVE